jgi:methylthioribose-1-phosphate isomerase
MSFRTIEWKGDRLVLLDQTLLPAEEVYREYTDYRAVAKAIVDMVVRGAPAIGVTAAFGIALAARGLAGESPEGFSAGLARVCSVFENTRPTAVNLFWAVERMRSKAQSLAGQPAVAVAEALETEARAICREDVEANRHLGRNGAELLPEECTVLTHCNA